MDVATELDEYNFFPGRVAWPLGDCLTENLLVPLELS